MNDPKHVPQHVLFARRVAAAGAPFVSLPATAMPAIFHESMRVAPNDPEQETNHEPPPSAA